MESALRHRVCLIAAVLAGALIFHSAPRAEARRTPVPRPIVPPRVIVVQTSGDLSQALTRLPGLRFERATPPATIPTIRVDDQARLQRVQGFGAAMTDTAAWLLGEALSPAQRAAALSALFGPRGIRLDFMRVPMGASDFTHDGQPYSYDDLRRGQRDPTLSRFSVDHDRAYIIPALREVLAINPGTEILANPWSPPAWMKTNDSLDNRAQTGRLLGPAYALVARYFVKFIQAYARLGIPIDAITPQNESQNATLYPGLNLDVAREVRLITGFLSPAFAKAGLRPMIYGNDAGWSVHSSTFAEGVATRAGGALTGIAWHCYFGNPLVMSTLHAVAGHLDQIVDECSPGITPFSVSELVISAMRNWASVVALWNLALDPLGGPVQPPNQGCPHCSGPLTIDEQSRTFVRTQAYYELGQASAYVQPGARRIGSDHFVSYQYTGPGNDVATPGLDDVAFLNPDGSRVLLAYDNAPTPAQFAVHWRQWSFVYTLAPGATVTFVWRSPKTRF